MGHPVLVPSNNENSGQRNHDQTFTKQPATTRYQESTPIIQVHPSDPSCSINTVEIVLMTFYKLHLDHLQF